MDTSLLYSIIQELDNQLGNVKLHYSNAETVKHLLELRNQIIQKHNPPEDIDWTIQNKNALNVIKHFEWNIIWK